MGRYRSRSRSPSPRRSSKRYDDPRDSRSRRDRRSPAPSGLLVRNISLDARPEDLRTPFERFGAIKDIYLPKNYYTGEPRGFGFVKFRYPEDAADAKEQLNRTVIGGREIRIVFAEENRKSPHEMRRTTRPSGRGSYRRRSPVRSPRRRHRSYSGSPSPARSDLRDRRAKNDDYSPLRSRSVSKSVSPRDERNYRSTMKSPRRSRSISRSHSPRDKRNYRSDLRSPSPRDNGKNQQDERSRSPRNKRNYRSDLRSLSPRDNGKNQQDERSRSPRNKRNYRSDRRSVSPRENGKNQKDERYDGPSRSQSPRGNARNPSRSPSRSLRYLPF